jgi:hypothetical protein
MNPTYQLYADSKEAVARIYQRFGKSVGEIEASTPVTEGEAWFMLINRVLVIEDRRIDHQNSKRFHFSDGEGVEVREESFTYGSSTTPTESVVSYHHFWICKHSWDPKSIIDTRRGWHERTCAKCGYLKSVDSSD